jgi:hypothetical protein
MKVRRQTNPLLKVEVVVEKRRHIQLGLSAVHTAPHGGADPNGPNLVLVHMNFSPYPWWEALVFGQCSAHWFTTSVLG